MLSRVLTFAESRGIVVRFIEQCCLNGAAGTSRGKEIEIRTAETDITITINLLEGLRVTPGRTNE